ncbi:hypothetical protein Tco_1253215 [Tanacetum coccineum]
MTSRPRTRVFRPGPVWGCDRLVSRAKVIENQVMVAPVICISSDTSEENVGSHAPRVILFGAILTIILVIPEVAVVPANPIVAPEVGTVLVVSPVGVLDLVDYSPSSDSDPSEDSLPLAPDLPLVSPFLCSDDSEADGEFEPVEQRPVSSSHDTLAPLSWPRKLLSARKRVRPIPARRLAWRRVSHHLLDHHSSPDSSSSSDVREDGEEFMVEASAADMREIVVDPLAIADSSESSRGGIPDLEDTIYDIVHYMSEEEFRQVRRDCDDTRRRLRRLESYVERHLGFRP